MFTELSAKTIKEMNWSLSVMLTVKNGWEINAEQYHQSIPSHILACRGTDTAEVFDCYSSIYEGNLDIGLVKPTDWLLMQGHAFIDFYLGWALRNLTDFSKRSGFKRLFFETEFPCIYDHFIDQKFTLFKSLKQTERIAGYKILNEKA